DDLGTEMTAQQLWEVFNQEYLHNPSPFVYDSHHLSESGNNREEQQITAAIQFNGQPFSIAGCGNGPIDAFLDALDLTMQVHHYEERSLSHGSNAAAIAFIELSGDFIPTSMFGAGIHENIVTASLLAILSAVNRAVKQVDTPTKHKLLKRFEHALIA
ncbi:MAG: alpha-isopropylmalate synthase regulatory domain-containing protein, partial [Leptolyngbyaceae bacterium]|nr:alpha-isopropylmalate synthase regulatory domain-containing protein [Leptolyngbyaceae bacterium]